MEKENISKKNIVARRYLVLEELGQGGYSHVFRAKDLKNGDIVALKRYKTHDIYNRQRLMADVERELNVLKYTAHPCLPKVFNIICMGDDFYLVMEYVEGKTIENILADRRLKKAEVISIARQILSALYYLHSLDPPIIYRDFKPANVILKDDGTVKLIDFGNAKRFNKDVSADDFAVGTPKFAAPEQFGTKEGVGIYNTDVRTDIYGVGAFIYYMITGLNIHAKGHRIKKIIYRLVYGKRFVGMIQKSVNKRPKDRYQSVIEMLVQLYM